MGDSTAKQELLKRLLLAHEAWFDVSRDYVFAGHTFAGYAEFHSYGEQYVLVKRAKLWEADSHEYLFFDLAEKFDLTALDEAVGFLTTQALAKVNPEPGHMQSFVSLVVLADEVDEQAARKLKKVRFRKNYLLGLRGWADVRIAAVDLERGRVITNGAGKELRGALVANLAVLGEQPSEQDVGHAAGAVVAASAAAAACEQGDADGRARGADCAERTGRASGAGRKGRKGRKGHKGVVSA